MAVNRDSCDSLLEKQLPIAQTLEHGRLQDSSPEYSVQMDQAQGMMSDRDSYLQVPEEPLSHQVVHGSSNKRKQYRLIDTWFWEVFCIGVSIGCLAIIAIVFSAYNNKPLTVWHLSMQVSTFLSVMSGLVKVSLLYPVSQCLGQMKWMHFRKPHARRAIDLQRFDNASQGPLGSLSLLCTYDNSVTSTSGRAPPTFSSTAENLIVSFLCFVTVLALALEPFTQQVVAIVPRGVPSAAGGALVAGAQAYNTSLGRTMADQYATAQEIDTGMQAAIITGIYGQSGNTLYTCSTGNCTFPGTWTLGVCASCEDVAKNSTLSCPYEGTFRKDCSITTPGNITLAATQNTEYWTMLDSVAEYNASDWVTLAHLAVLAIVREPDEYTAGGTEVELQLEQALKTNSTITECNVQLCERYYDAFNVTNAISDDASFTSYPLKYTGQHKVAMVEGDVNDNDTSIAFEGINGFNYTVDAADLLTAAYNLVVLFNTSLKSSFANSNEDQAAKLTPFDISNVLHQRNNTPQVLSNLTDRMTDYIRTSNPANLNSSKMAGTTFKEVSYIQVTLGWLGFPTSVVLSVALILVYTIYSSKSQKIPVWKSSNLPYLYYAIPKEDAPARAYDLDRLSGMEEAAWSTRTRLDMTGEEGPLTFVAHV